MESFRQRPHDVCSACDRPIQEDQKLCACGTATPYMSFAERAAYEVQQWRAHQRRIAG